MDNETKIVIISMLETLREIAESAFEAQEMSWQTFVTLQSQPGFQEAHETHKGVSFEKIQHLRHGILARLDGEIQRLREHI